MAATLASALMSVEDQRDLAQMMRHSHQTQQRTYNKCIQTSKSVRKICSNMEVEEDDLQEAEMGE